MNDHRVVISWDECTSCFACVDVCTNICPECGQPMIIRHMEQCDGCGACIMVCPQDAISLEKTQD